jgi:hypothetical protein
MRIRKWMEEKTLHGYNLGDLVPVVIAFALIAIIGAVALLILGNFSTNSSVATCTNGGYILANGVCSNGGTNTIIATAAYNGIYQGISGINQIMSFLPLIALVVVAAVIIGVVVGAFVLGGKREEGF